ncbi:MAG: ATP-binding protein [Actinomycetota bacterium]|nr:ATP-binding protein [Actinomycetota bacterium]
MQISRNVAGSDRALIAAVVDSTEDAVVSVDRDGVVTTWNAGATAIFGYTPDEIVGRPVSLAFQPAEETSAMIAGVCRGEPVTHYETIRHRKDGSSVAVSESLSPVRDDVGSIIGAAWISRDISLRRAMEDALNAAQRELEARHAQLERSNAELEQFAYVASHDLSEPLRAVAGMVQLLARRYKGRLGSDADEYIAFATEGCERMRALIEDVLAYSRVSRGELDVVDVDMGQLAAAVVRALGAQIADAGAEVVIGELPVIRADRRQMTQVLQNLLSNAVKFRRSGVRPLIEVTAGRHGDAAWVFTVADNGIGIDPQYRSRIFRMFQRLHTRDAYTGTGIGLAIAERVVTRHDGRIWLDDRPGEGSAFSFTIPDRVGGEL